MITENEFKIIKNIVLSEFPVYYCYKALQSDEWTGWKPNNFDDIYKTIGELIRLVETDNNYNHLNFEGCYSTGGFMVGFIDGYFIISWDFNNENFNFPLKQKPLTIDFVRKKSYICTEIDCIEFLRMYKIYKLWHKKDKEITTTTETTIFPQG
jgi:hypothetical protein